MANRDSTFIASALLLAGALIAGAAAGGGPDSGRAMGGAAAPQRLRADAVQDARTYFTDTLLLTQDGREVRFYSDVLEDRVVLLNIMYASCKDACPLITRKLKAARAALGDALARRVHFVSITSDPGRDSPQALQAFAAKNDALDANWTFLTGDRKNVDLVLARLGQLSESAEGHSTLLIAGDVAARRWTKIRPDASPELVAERLKRLTESSASGTGGSGT